MAGIVSSNGWMLFHLFGFMPIRYDEYKACFCTKKAKAEVAFGMSWQRPKWPL
jgi:hypothetical protein